MNNQLLFEKDLPGDRHVQVWPLTFGRAKLCVGPKKEKWYENEW